MHSDKIIISGAREHNLKGLDLTLPKNQLIVFTGLSGSGKSTLAFGTLYAEGQRRYIESLSAYARQFLDRIAKPEVDKIEGLTPAIAIDQKSTSKNPRSTVGTITEIYDYLRLLFARVGTQHCPSCGGEISSMSAADILGEISKLPLQAKLLIYAPLVREKKGSFAELLETLRLKGFIRVKIDGSLLRLDEEITLAKTKKHSIALLIDRLGLDDTARLAAAVESALAQSYGELELELANFDELVAEAEAAGAKKAGRGGEAAGAGSGAASLARHYHFSEHRACFKCKLSFAPLEPLSFSFNSPKGACEGCDGLGIRYTLDLSRIIDEGASLEAGAVKTMYGFNKSYYYKFLLAFAEVNEIPTQRPFGELSAEQRRLILYGNAGLVSFFWKRHRIKKSFAGVVSLAYEQLKDEKDLAEYMSEKPCPDCAGHRLAPASLAVRVGGVGLAWLLDTSIAKVSAFFADEAKFAQLSPQQALVAGPILKELRERLFFLQDVGLGYLTLGRDARSISGGEAQRIRIASQIGSGLSGVLYVLDEPSIGLHERDTERLIKTLRSLQEKGNTLIVVEHDKRTIQAADFIVDIGPGAGKNGGEVVFAGTYEKLLKSPSLTAKFLNGKAKIDLAKHRPQQAWLGLKNVSVNNISGLSAALPLGNFLAITGVSGSGKSSLILQTLLPIARTALNHAKRTQLIEGVEITGLDQLDKVIYLDQSPIGRTPRSNPATYTGVMDELRVLFAQTKEAKMRGFLPGRFSFNVRGGRCEKCAGDGQLRIEMHFLPDVLVLCDACKGSRYNEATLEIKYKGKNIAQVLEMSVGEACDFFKALPKISQRLNTLAQVGLDYLALGQNATTLSGGEAQRIKLAKELGRSDTGRTLYVLDEPTTGLHFEDVRRLVAVLQHLVDLGNSVMVIEHNLDLIKNADFIIDLGPEGGAGGGRIIATGSPEELARNHQKTGSFTGKYLAEEFAQEFAPAKKAKK